MILFSARGSPTQILSVFMGSELLPFLEVSKKNLQEIISTTALSMLEVPVHEYIQKGSYA